MVDGGDVVGATVGHDLEAGRVVVVWHQLERHLAEGEPTEQGGQEAGVVDIVPNLDLALVLGDECRERLVEGQAHGHRLGEADVGPQAVLQVGQA